MDTSFTAIVAALLALTVWVASRALGKRPTGPLIVGVQIVAITVMATYAVLDRQHRYISLLFVLIGTVNLSRRIRAAYR